MAAIAPWFCLRLPSCGPGFESQAHHLSFFQFVLKLLREKNKNKQRRGMDWPIFIIITDPLRVTTELQFVERYPHLFLNLMFFCIFKYLSLKSVFNGWEHIVSVSLNHTREDLHLSWEFPSQLWKRRVASIAVSRTAGGVTGDNRPIRRERNLLPPKNG